LFCPVFYVLAVNRDLINRALSTLLVVIGSQSFFFNLVSFVTGSLEAIDTCMAFFSEENTPVWYPQHTTYQVIMSILGDVKFSNTM